MSEKNPILKQFNKYLLMNYSNKKTRELYFSRAKWLLAQIEKQTNKEPTKITQDMFDFYMVYLRQLTKPNSFYYGFISAWRNCFDPEDAYGKRTFGFKVVKDKSRRSVIRDEYDWLEKESVDKIIAEANTYISLTTQLFFETGLREMELLNTDLSPKPTDDIGIKSVDLKKRRISGIGKGNKEFSLPISKSSAERLEVWLTDCKDPYKPFMLYRKSSGNPFKNLAKAYWYRLRKETDRLGIRLANGKKVHPHAYRHTILRWLRREKKWQIEELAKFGRHENINTTKIYSGATIEEVEKKLNEEVFDK